MKTNETELIEFSILRLDFMAQGVHFEEKESAKAHEGPAFIPQTLPGEKGLARIVKKKKGVRFAVIQKIETKSPHRIASDCIHYSKCNGCHYLHTDYEHEINFKKDTFLFALGKSQLENLPSLSVFKAPKRLNWRNRIQLHYDLKKNILGLKNTHEDTIISIPNCLIGTPLIQQGIKELYQESKWKKLIASSEPKEGHIELYEKNGVVECTVNEQYASGGFTQVFEEMNEKMHQYIEGLTIGDAPCLDLFGGNGNLSKKFKTNRLIVDFYTDSKGNEKQKKEKSFFSLNLYDKRALNSLSNHAFIKSGSIHTLIIDPPRSGFSATADFVKRFKPNVIIYVSCNHQTQLNDIKPLVTGSSSKYEIAHLALFDLFPSTFHFETVIVLKKK